MILTVFAVDRNGVKKIKSGNRILKGKLLDRKQNSLDVQIVQLTKCLNSDLKVQVAHILAQKPMSVREVFENLKDTRPKYRQTVYKVLERMQECGLAEKFYDRQRKRICYRLIAETIEISFARKEVLPRKDDETSK